MRTAQVGDRVQVRWTKLFQDGSLVSSRGRAPTELIIGIDHPRLPGLGLALVGLLVGESARLIVSARQGYGPFDPGRIHRLSRTWFPEHEDLPLGKWVRVWDRRHRPHLVRIVAVRDRMVVVATNHRWAGQALELEVKLLAILDPDTGFGADRSRSRARMGQISGQILEGGGTRPSSDHSSPRPEVSFADSGC